MIEQKKIIFTGGSGLLGSEFRKILPDIHYPTSTEFNVTRYDEMERYVSAISPEMIVHAAAFTSPPKIDEDPIRAVETNIIGTANVVKLCMKHGMKLVYISTDYVFKGDKGNYCEDDPVYPVNRYAWSKLGGECAVRMYDNSIIIRTTFGPNVFPYEKAFVDQWTSRESVSVIAGMIAGLLDVDFRGTVHVGGPRKTVYEYASALSPDRNISELSIHDVSFTVPVDTSMQCNLYHSLIKEKEI